MKNFIKLTALALVAVLLVAVFASCAPNSDPLKAKHALEENGYSATKLDADGNFLESGIIAAMKLADISDITNVVIGTKTVGEGEEATTEEVTIIYFKNKDVAKVELGDVQEYAGSKYECKQSGNMIYYGTKAAIKAAK